jgi:hypothetical protein
MTWMGLVCMGALTTSGAARAQTSSSAAAASAASANNFSNMTMGMGFMPMPGMFGSASPSATDAAALGVTSPQGGMFAAGGNNMFMNPMASPYLYGSMFPMTQQQTGMMMLAGQAQMLGIGSGRLSGTRPGTPAAGVAKRRQMQSVPGAHGSANQPGGLAARYFNRMTQKPRSLQGFYNRPNQHYPQAGR